MKESYLAMCFRIAVNSGADPASVKQGMKIALEAFGIYKDGEQKIGAQEIPVKQIIEEINSL